MFYEFMKRVGESDKMQVFCRFNKWNKTGVRRLDFTYHMA